MKRILILILAIFISVPLIGTFTINEVKASGEYEVAYIEDNGSFTTVASYSSLTDATNKMKENDDYVVRHQNSQSPSKIIAMNSGLVYSYPYRRGYSTINIYQSVNSSLVGAGVSTYVAEHYEMTYHSTYYYYAQKGMGWVEVTLNGFHGYTDLEYTDLVPTKFIKNSIPITLGGGDTTGGGEEAFSVKCEQNYYYKDGDDLKLCFHRAWSKTSGGNALSSTLTIGKAPSFMESGKHYYSNDGINFYSDSKLNNIVGTYYNFYQFLPLRTYSKISASTMNSYVSGHSGSIIEGEGQSFVNAQNNYGCNAAIILCMAIHESAWGTSNIAKGKNNLFGWGAYDDATSNAARYSSVEACVNSQMADNLANYMDVKCSRYFSMSLGNKGGGFITKYASDPYWAEKIASYYYALDKKAGFVDYDYYKDKLAIVNTTNANIKASPSDSAATLYQTANKNGYQKNLIVITLGTEGTYTKTQLSNPVDDDGVVYPITLDAGTLVDYDSDKSVGYIKNTDLITINANGLVGTNPSDNTNITPEDIADNGDLNGMSSVSQFDLVDNNITLKGTAFIEKVNFNDSSKITHSLVFKDLTDDEKEYVYSLTTCDSTLDLGDKYIYKYIGYEGTISLNELPLGDYSISIRVHNGTYNKDVVLKSSNNKFFNKISTVSNVQNRLTTNAKYNYRFELQILSSPLNYANILKPTMNRQSMFSFISTDIDDDLNLTIEANAMIYYLNYNNKDNISYKAYLIKNNTEYVELNTTLIDSPYNYNELLESEYDMTNICFKATGNISTLEGDYYMVVVVTNKSDSKTYIDYVDMYKSSDSGLASKTLNNKSYYIVKTNVNNRTILSCSKVAEESE